MTTDERGEDIEYWWEGGFPGAFAADFLDNPVEPRLYQAFRRVLLAMPDEDFERFLELRPTIVCQPAADGAVYRYLVPFMQGMEEDSVRVIYFTPAIRKYSEERLVRLVAHETAHVVLGHADNNIAAGHGDIHAEEATDRKSESWGFKGAYSKAHRRRLTAQHARDKRRFQG